MKIYSFNVDLSYSNPELKIELEGELRSDEYNTLVTQINSVPSPEFQLVTKNYIDEQLNKYKNKEKKVGTFGGYFTVDGKDVYITKVIYNKPVVIVFWSDGTKTRSTCDDQDIWNTELGLSLCVMKKLIGQDSVSKLIQDWNVTSSPVEIADADDRRPPKIVTLKDVRKNHKEEKEAEKFAKRLS